MRERIKANAVCSSKNYAASKRVHKAHLERNHAAFALLAKTENGIGKGDSTLSHDRQMAITNAKVKVSIWGHIQTVTKTDYEEHYAPLGFPIVG